MAYHPVVRLPEDVAIFDFTRGYDADRPRPEYGIGRYDEKRPGMYVNELFEGRRDVHVGIDIGAPVGTPVHAFDGGTIFRFGENPAPGDYGPTLITEHAIDGRPIWVLLGHLSRRSLEGKRAGDRFARGDVLGWIGDRHENGGWNPHVHVQLAWSAPDKPDLPGVVSDADRAQALELYPDPRLILGPIY